MKNTSVIVAFLQNAWVRDPECLQYSIARHNEAFRLDMLRRLLFAGCLTGRRLRAAFGPFCEQIVWEECTREIADNPRVVLPAQPEHIADVIYRLKPIAVLAFGNHAFKNVSEVYAGKLFRAPHPAARQAATAERLADTATLLDVYLNKPHLPALSPRHLAALRAVRDGDWRKGCVYGYQFDDRSSALCKCERAGLVECTLGCHISKRWALTDEGRAALARARCESREPPASALDSRMKCARLLT